MKKSPSPQRRSALIASFLLFFLLLLIPVPAAANLSNTPSTPLIQITSPLSDHAYKEKIDLMGVTGLDEVWLCLRGPAGEISVYPAVVRPAASVDLTTGGRNTFSFTIWLRFGPGVYTFWLGNNSHYFDGKACFEVVNAGEADLRHTAPSAYVDSDNPVVVEIARSIIRAGMSNEEKLTALYQWATHYITYDYNAYEAGDNKLIPASEVIRQGKGTCRDYAFVVAALARAAGLPARVVYGQAQIDSGTKLDHAWNEVCANGRWINADAAWDAGLTKPKYFNQPDSLFSTTHMERKYPTH